jgi:hypothetical protein
MKRERSQGGEGLPESWSALSQSELFGAVQRLVGAGKVSVEDVSQALAAEPEPKRAKPQSEPKGKKKPKKEFDMSKYKQRYVALRVLYFGESLRGYSSMGMHADEETVEGLLLGALMRVRLIESGKTCALARSGRTDKGVSAFGQVVSLRVRSKARSTVRAAWQVLWPESLHEPCAG